MRIFKEEQRFTQSWLIVLLFVTMIGPIALITKEFFQKDSTKTTTEFIAIIAIIFFFTALIFFFKLVTRIDEKGIQYLFFPFHFKTRTIPWGDINKAYTRKYDAITDYGGWGIKSNFLRRKNKGVAFNIKGDLGLQLELSNGKKILIGTQKKADVDRVLKNYKYKITSDEK